MSVFLYIIGPYIITDITDNFHAGELRVSVNNYVRENNFLEVKLNVCE